MTRSGDCCKCGGRYNVYASKRSDRVVVRYLRCSRCTSTAKETLPAELVRKRFVPS